MDTIDPKTQELHALVAGNMHIPSAHGTRKTVRYRGERWEVCDSFKSIRNASRELLIRRGERVVVVPAGACNL